MDSIEVIVLLRRAVLALPLTLAGCGAEAGALTDFEEGKVQTTQSELSLRSGNLWPPLWNGLTRIRLCFTNGTSAQRTRVKNVAEGSWEAIAASTTGPFGRYGVDFVGWGSCPSNATGMIPITFNNGITNQTDGLGRGTRSMALSTLATDGTIIHEFGHALGYTHEFLRTDYGDVDPDCSVTRGTPPDLAVSPVDTASVMSYEVCGSSDAITLVDAVSHMGLYGPWIVEYGKTIAMRHDPSWNYVRGDSTPDTSTNGILADREFSLVKVSGNSNQVSFGDSVRIRTHNGLYLKSNGEGNLVTTTTSASSSTVWTVFGRITSGPVRVNDEVLFRASDSAYLRTNSSQRLTTGVGEFFRLAHLWLALNLSP